MNTVSLTIAAAAFLAASGAVQAQTSSATTITTTGVSTATIGTGASINQRKENQEDRIAQGVKSGELTAGESATLESQEAGINKEEAGMRAQDNGKLTGQDKATLKSQLNTESKDIYADKHNSATQPAEKGEVNKRLENQQDRIAKGINSDTLTDGQVAKLETQEAGVTKEEAGMRAQDNGKLTAQDKKLLNKQLNRESRRINRDERRTEHK